MTSVLDGVLKGYVFFAELVLECGWTREVDGRDGWRIRGSDCGLLGWGAVEGVLENAFRSLCRGTWRGMDLGRSF